MKYILTMLRKRVFFCPSTMKTAIAPVTVKPNIVQPSVAQPSTTQPAAAAAQPAVAQHVATQPTVAEDCLNHLEGLVGTSVYTKVEAVCPLQLTCYSQSNRCGQTLNLLHKPSRLQCKGESGAIAALSRTA